MVKSIIWSQMTRSPGWNSSFREPTAQAEITYLHPSFHRAYMLALYGTEDGGCWCCFPWRKRKAISTPLILPIMMGSEGFPKGVSGNTSSMSSKLSGL